MKKLLVILVAILALSCEEHKGASLKNDETVYSSPSGATSVSKVTVDSIVYVIVFTQRGVAITPHGKVK